MTSNTHIDFYGLIPESERFVTYSGSFDNQIMNDLIDEMRNSLRKLRLPFRVTKGIYSIAIESIENIVKHGATNDDSIPHGKFVFGKTDGAYSLIIENSINDYEMMRLKNRLDEVKGLDLENIKSLYRHELIYGKVSEKGGAGLGIYIMALRCNNNIKYNIESLGKGKHKYTICVSLTD